jgi:hypothetical protein
MTSTETTDDKRATYISGLRKLADLLESAPDVKLPDTGANPTHGHIDLCVSNRDEMAAWAPSLEDAREDTKGSLHYIRGRIDGIHISVYGSSKVLGGRDIDVTRTTTEYAVPPILAETDAPMSDRIASAFADLMLADAELRGEVSSS